MSNRTTFYPATIREEKEVGMRIEREVSLR
jgi:hypothetical protein